MSDTEAINRALERAMHVVTARPERGQRVYRTVARVGRGLLCRTEEAGRSLTLDMGKALGGADAGPNPSMVLRSAVSACVAIGVKQWAARRGVPVERVEVTLETDVDARGQLGLCRSVTPGFTAMRLDIAVTSPAPEPVIEALVAESLEFSPLMDVVERPQRVERRISLTRPGGSEPVEETA